MSSRWLVALLLLVAKAAAAPGPVHLHQYRAVHDDVHDDAQDLHDLVRAEQKAWKDAGFPDFLQFHDDNGQLVWGAVVGEQPSAKPGSPPTPSLEGKRKDGADVDAGDDDVKFHVYTQRNNYSSVDGTLVQLVADEFLQAGWHKDLPTKVVIHGFANSISSPIIQTIKDAYMNHTGEVNVIGVDWGVLCPNPLYVTARLNVPFVGTRVGQLLQFLVEQNLTAVDRLHVIGHSLGAHVAGLSAKALNETTGMKPFRVTGLDPAWPLFFLTAETDRLNQDDGDMVDVIHTCAGFLGFSAAIGTTDFYPNGGRDQPGCGYDLTGACAHSRSFQYFAETIKTGKGYMADYCENYTDARNGKCTVKPDGCMGDKVHYKEQGAYYLKTNEDEPVQEC